MAYLITGIYTGIILVFFEARLEAIGLGEYDNLFDATIIGKWCRCNSF